MAARAALATTLADLRGDLVHAVDVRAWAVNRPWTTVGAATATGLAAALLVVPRRAADRASQAATAGASVPPRRSRITAALWSSASAAMYGLARIAVTQVLAAATHPDLPEDHSPPQPVDQFAEEAIY